MPTTGLAKCLLPFAFRGRDIHYLPSHTHLHCAAMAGLVHPSPQFGFRPIAVDHSPSPLNYGFGLSGAVGFPSWQPHSSQTPPTQPSQSSVQKSTQKRKHEDADEDELMDRSPTPERRPIRRIRPVRSRLTEHEDKSGKEAKPSSLEFGDGIDVGMLLGKTHLTISTVACELTICIQPAYHLNLCSLS